MRKIMAIMKVGINLDIVSLTRILFLRVYKKERSGDSISGPFFLISLSVAMLPNDRLPLWICL